MSIGNKMAIIIPSKNIYDKKNPKIRDNVIDKINAKTSLLEIKSSKDVGVNSFERTDINSNFDTDTIAQNYVIDDTSYGSVITYVASIIKPKYKDYTTSFNKIYSDRKIQKINVDRISVSVLGTKRIGSAEAIIQTDPNDKIDWHIYKMSIESETEIVSNEYLYFPELKETTEFEGLAPVVAEAENNQKIEKLTVDDAIYEVISKCLIGLEKYSFGGKSIIKQGSNGLPTAYIDGIYEIYEPQKVEVQIFGDYIELQNKEEVITYGNGQNIFTLENNELLQKESKYNSKYNQIPISEKLGSATMSEYSNGKETCELLCSVGEYYNEAATLSISTKQFGLPMLFELGNTVIPMKYGADGKDVPISQNKEFKVVGVEPFYDGAVWQRLTLQEK